MSSGFSRWVSKLICAYTRHFPLRRGKWRLLKWASSFLVVELEPGAVLRISDLENPIELGLAMKGLLEEEDLRLFLSLMQPGMTILDLGANVGMYTVMAARRVGPSGRVHAFEPTPQVAAKLRKNVQLNGLSNVTLQQFAVSDTPGVCTFFLNEECNQNSLIATKGTPIEVKAVTIDGYVNEMAVAQVDMIKMDIEGAEAKAVRGGKSLLSSEHAPLLMLEFNQAALEQAGTNANELRDLLEGCGYECHKLQADGAHTQYNVLAIKPFHYERFSASALNRFSTHRNAMTSRTG